MGDNIKPLTESDNWCKTIVGETIRSRFTWTIEGFKRREEKRGEQLRSNTFKICDPEGKVSSWFLILYPRGNTKTDDENPVSLYLQMVDEDNVIKIDSEMYILDVNSTKQNIHPAKSCEYEKKKPGWGFRNFLSRDNLENEDWLPDDKLTIGCEITLYGTGKTVSGCKYIAGGQKIEPVTTESCQQQLSQDLQKLLLDKDLADFEIICGDKSLPCHANVLSARSPVFRAMFISDMTEKKKGKVEIQGFSFDVIQNMLHFVYTGMLSTPELDESGAADLLGAADQYQLDLLKRVCENKLCEILDVDNCLRLLTTADMYRADRIKKIAMELVVKNMNTIVIKSSEDWKRCVKNHPDLVVEIIEEQAKRNGI